MNSPLVSVIIPTFNYAHFVVEAVESALAQSYSPLEIIVVDDGSTDNTRDCLAPYLSRIHYIYQANAGLSAARNTGIAAARGEWVAFLDSDDKWHPRKIEIQIRCVLKDPSVRLIATTTTTASDGKWESMEDTGLATVPFTVADLFVRNRFSPSSVLMQTSVFREVGLFDSELRSAEDRDMWIRTASVGKVERLQAALTFYRLHASSMSTNALRMEANIRCMLQKSTRIIPELQTRSSKALIRKAWAYCDFECSIMYQGSGLRWLAFVRVLRSLYLYPRSFGPESIEDLGTRIKMLIRLLVPKNIGF